MLSHVLTTYLVSKEIINTTNEIVYYSNHLFRCKKDSDKAKLTIMVIGRIAYECKLIQKLNELTKQNITLLCENKLLPLN